MLELTYGSGNLYLEGGPLSESANWLSENLSQQDALGLSQILYGEFGIDL